MVIYLIRHGETDWNKQNKLQGIEDIELNETGLLQSQVLAQAFVGVPVDLILTSPLKRAKVTAEILSEHIKVGPVIVEQGLTERDFGKLSGFTYAHRDILFARNEDPCMEPKEELIERFMGVLKRYIPTADSIVVVSHGASINLMLSHLSDGVIGTGKTVLKNTCISKLRCIDEKIDIDYDNLTPDEFAEL